MLACKTSISRPSFYILSEEAKAKLSQLDFKMFGKLIVLWYALICGTYSSEPNRSEIINILFNRPAQPSVSQFPPVLEFIVQKVQSQFSNYVYEDLSRPPVWNKPVYTLSPEDQVQFASVTDSTNTTTVKEDRFDYVDTDNTTEIFFEIIVDQTGDKNKNILDNTTDRLFETIKTSQSPGNKSFVYITPKKPYTTTPTTAEIKEIKLFSDELDDEE